jgi:long-chain acyl-CoA synthetase
LECIYGTSPFIFPNGLLVYGDSFQNNIVAVVLLKESYVKDWAKEKNINDEFENLVDNKTLKEEILESFKEISKKENKKSFEYITKVHLTTKEWTPENEMLTSAMKINRLKVLSVFKNDIEKLYQ